jgi:hypothetical protein
MLQNDTQGILGWQAAPFDWSLTGSDPWRYVQGQVLRLGLCDNDPSCIESTKAFAAETNDGLYSFDAAAYTKSLVSTAQYLLGVQPASGIQVDMSAPILQTGRGIGDYIHFSQQPGNLKDYTVISSVENLEKDPVFQQVKIHASIAAGGLYPLRVSNGSDVPLDDNCLPDTNRWTGNGLKPNTPYTLHLNAGVELYWRIGNGPLQHSDGSKAVDIGPITSEASAAFRAADGTWTTKPGIPSVRIVAINTAKDAVKLTGDVTLQQPKAVATPDNIAGADTKTEMTLRVDFSQVALNYTSVRADWDFGDGTPVENSTIKPDAKMQASISVKHTFKAATTAVRVTFYDKNGKAVLWDAVVIPVKVAATGRWYKNITQALKGTEGSTNGEVSADGATASWGPMPTYANPGDTWSTQLTVTGNATLAVYCNYGPYGGQWHMDEWSISSPGSTDVTFTFPPLDWNFQGCLVKATAGSISDTWTYYYQVKK